nr:PREDICTED: uncharacterized protein LOC107398164 [Tribolium castaneum]|eukprot:XP_015836783.1 PREDICTED: uncharacterized protein LOC107398164 [Tribolium castaneum]
MGYDCYFAVTYSNIKVFKLFQTLDYKIKTMSSCEEKLKQVFTENGEPLKTDEGYLVFQQQADGCLVIVENNDAGSASTSNSDKRTADKRIKWCHNAIINLIAFRKELDPEFRSQPRKRSVALFKK